MKELSKTEKLQGKYIKLYKEIYLQQNFAGGLLHSEFLHQIFAFNNGFGESGLNLNLLYNTTMRWGDSLK